MTASLSASPERTDRDTQNFHICCLMLIDIFAAPP
jgi:hypothetical protein